MAIPFYSTADQAIYEGGNKFIPQEQYRLNYTPSTALASTIGGTGGVTRTQAAIPYIWPPQGGGDGGGGGDNVFGYDPNQNLGSTNITDYEADAAGVGSTWAGSLAKLKDDLSNLPTPTNLLRKGIMKWKAKREAKKAEKVAQQKIEREQTIKDYSTWKSPSGRDHEGTGGIGSPESKKGAAPGQPGASKDWRAQGGRIGFKDGLSAYQLFKLKELGYPHAGSNPGGYGGLAVLRDILKLHKYKDGGRIGYQNGEFVEDVNVEGPGFDVNENLMASDDNNTRILENLFEKYLELGFSPQDAEIKAMEEFELMSQGPEQDQGLASLV